MRTRPNKHLATLAWLCALGVMSPVIADAGTAECDRAASIYQEASGAPVRDRDTVDRSYRDAAAACGGRIGQMPQAANVDTPRSPASDPGELVNCDAKGCWGSANGVRYTFAGGANLSGGDGTSCVRGSGNSSSATDPCIPKCAGPIEKKRTPQTLKPSHSLSTQVLLSIKLSDGQKH